MKDPRKDIRIDDITGDIYTNAISKDFDIVASDQQHVKDLIEFAPGHLKEFPLAGVAIVLSTNATGKIPELKRKIKVHLESDGYRTDDNFISELYEIYLAGEKL